MFCNFHLRTLLWRPLCPTKEMDISSDTLESLTSAINELKCNFLSLSLSHFTLSLSLTYTFTPTNTKNTPDHHKEVEGTGSQVRRAQ